MSEPSPTAEAAEGGRRSARVRLVLQPVKYKITLVYMGNDRIARDNANYRCRYELHRAMMPLVGFPAVIPNCVRQGDTTAAANAAARPSNQGGDSTNPPNDVLYRVLIRDNHALRRTDSEGGNFLGAGGNNHSRYESYRQRGWLPDIRPAVPFRVIVRKFVGDQQTDIEENMRVIVEVKDPVEELQINQDQPHDFLQGFFNKYNRTDADPDPGDDNALRDYSGDRARSSSSPGVPAENVLRAANYLSPHNVDVPSPAPAQMPFASLRAPDRHDAMLARYTLTQVDHEGHKVGCAEMIFRPWTSGGDNYRFLLTVVNNGNMDVRSLQMNGADVTVVDDADQIIPRPRAYVTGRFVTWKRVDIKLMVRVNDTADADIDWIRVAGIYRRQFMEIVGPEISSALTVDAWRTELRAEFTGLPAPLANRLGNDAEPDLSLVSYGNELIPPFLHGQANLRQHVLSLCRRIVASACANEVPAITDPGTNTNQNNSEGLFLVLARVNNPGYRAAGTYLGDRTWLATRQATTDATTSTCAHEMGHSFYLRHSHTSRFNVQWVPPAAAAYTVSLVQGHENNTLEDHDQEDAYACLLSYTRPMVAYPCGVCNLVLRMYNRVRLQQKNASNYGNQIVDHLRQPTIVRIETLPGPVFRLTPSPGPLALNDVIDVMAVSDEENFTPRNGVATPGRVNVSRAGQGHRWQVTGANHQLMDDRVRITANARGQINVRYTCGELNAQAVIQVN